MTLAWLFGVCPSCKQSILYQNKLSGNNPRICQNNMAQDDIFEVDLKKRKI